MSRAARLLSLLRGDPVADRVVPPSGIAAWLTLVTAAIMAFLAVFALSLSLATARVAGEWSSALSSGATVRIPAGAGAGDAEVAALLRILSETPGVASARALDDADQRALLAPWLGTDLPIGDLPVPRLVEIAYRGNGPDAEGLRMRLAAEMPEAVLDDHSTWRRPLLVAARRLSWLGAGALALIGVAMAASITLAAGAALAANRQAMGVLRMVGARDAFIVRAFVRRFTLRALAGSAAGTVVGMLALSALPRPEEADGLLTGLSPTGAGWLAATAIPPLAAIVAFWATRAAAFRALREIP